jgi:hypothetical protein
MTKHCTRRTRRATREERRARNAQWVVEELDERTRETRVVSYHWQERDAAKALLAPGEEVSQ